MCAGPALSLAALGPLAWTLGLPDPSALGGLGDNKCLPCGLFTSLHDIVGNWNKSESHLEVSPESKRQALWVTESLVLLTAFYLLLEMPCPLSPPPTRNCPTL